MVNSGALPPLVAGELAPAPIDLARHLEQSCCIGIEHDLRSSPPQWVDAMFCNKLVLIYQYYAQYPHGVLKNETTSTPSEERID